MKPSLVSGLVTLVLAVALPLVPPPSASAAEPTYDLCASYAPTIVGTHGTVRGTDKRDVIIAGPGTLVLAGSGDDLICTYGGDVKAGSGDDNITVLSSGSHQTGDLELGQGNDSVGAAGTGLTLLDLRRDVLRTSAGRFRVENAEVFWVGSDDRVEVRGGPRADHVNATGCHLSLRGGGGSDTLNALKGGTCGDIGSTIVARVYGDAGNDELRGTTAQDELRGGPGHDEANGVRGYDLCRAEVLRHCDH